MTVADGQRLPWLSIALVSAAALAYEVLLMRLFSIIQWHHFAYMMISLALLGYGVSGAFLMLLQGPLLRRFAASYIINLALFGVSSVGCFLLAQHIPFNAEEVLWDPRQTVWLLCTYLLLAVPFFFAANAIGLALIYYRERLSRIYAADLLGAGLGSIAYPGAVVCRPAGAGTDGTRPAPECAAALAGLPGSCGKGLPLPGCWCRWPPYCCCCRTAG